MQEGKHFQFFLFQDSLTLELIRSACAIFRSSLAYDLSKIRSFTWEGVKINSLSGRASDLHLCKSGRDPP